MVNVNHLKELQNVLPKCNPFYLPLIYNINRMPCRVVDAAGKPLFTSAHLNNFSIAHNQHKNKVLRVPLLLHLPFVVHIRPHYMTFSLLQMLVRYHFDYCSSEKRGSL